MRDPGLIGPLDSKAPPAVVYILHMGLWFDLLSFMPEAAILKIVGYPVVTDFITALEN